MQLALHGQAVQLGIQQSKTRFLKQGGDIRSIRLQHGDRLRTPAYEGQRLEGMPTIYASPVGANDHIYLPSREGVTKVIKAGPAYAEIATNKLDDQFDSSPVIIGGDLYLRGHNSIYCISESK